MKEDLWERDSSRIPLQPFHHSSHCSTYSLLKKFSDLQVLRKDFANFQIFFPTEERSCERAARFSQAGINFKCF